MGNLNGRPHIPAANRNSDAENGLQDDSEHNSISTNNSSELYPSSSSRQSVLSGSSDNDSVIVPIASSDQNGIQPDSPQRQSQPPSIHATVAALSAWLFGDDATANTLSPEHIAFLKSIGRPLPEIHNATPVRCPFNLHRASLQVIPADEDNASKYRIQFTFDADEPCMIQILDRVVESEDHVGEQFSSQNKKAWTEFEPGFKQLYSQPMVEYFDFSNWKEEEFEERTDPNFFPIAIIISSRNPSSLEVVQHVTLANVIRCADETYVVKPIRQKIKINGKRYIIYDIYGIDNNDEAGKECVVCMSDPRDTTVLPCRHMCLCHDCADVLRKQTNKCPICRSTVRSLVQIRDKASSKVFEEEEEEEEEEIKLVKKIPKGKREILVDDLSRSTKSDVSEEGAVS